MVVDGQVQDFRAGPVARTRRGLPDRPHSAALPEYSKRCCHLRAVRIEILLCADVSETPTSPVRTINRPHPIGVSRAFSRLLIRLPAHGFGPIDKPSAP